MISFLKPDSQPSGREGCNTLKQLITHSEAVKRGQFDYRLYSFVSLLLKTKKMFFLMDIKKNQKLTFQNKKMVLRVALLFSLI